MPASNLLAATNFDQNPHQDYLHSRLQLAADECPKNSIYGYAKATSPLLDGRLQGPVYLTSSDHELPDLLADLKGQVPIRFARRDQLEERPPQDGVQRNADVAVNKFILNMKGGSKGLLNPLRVVRGRHNAIGSRQPVGSEQPADEGEQPAAQHPACRRGNNN